MLASEGFVATAGMRIHMIAAVRSRGRFFLPFPSIYLSTLRYVLALRYTTSTLDDSLDAGRWITVFTGTDDTH